MERRTFLGWLAAASALPLVSCGDNDHTDRVSRIPHDRRVGRARRRSGGRLHRARRDHRSRRRGLLLVPLHRGRRDVAGRPHAHRAHAPLGRPAAVRARVLPGLRGRWFHAWRAVVERDDVDFVLFIGDYIYETIGHLDAKLPPDRTPSIPDGLELDDPLKGKVAAWTLEDYRALYREYRRDPDLRAMHAQFPFVAMWDDHEFANDCWRDHATDFDDLYGDEEEPERRAAASQAWFEYMPARARALPVFRSLRWGQHAEIVLLDERCYRDDHVVPEGPIDRAVGHIEMNSAFGARTFTIKDVFDEREAAKPPTMLGTDQRKWAFETLRDSTATWKVVASPLVMSQMVLDLRGYAQLPDPFRQLYYFKTDQWDGFRSERRAFLEACRGIDDLVVLSGDIHGFSASTLHGNFDAPDAPIAVEYVTSAISAATVDVQLDAVVLGNAFLRGLGLADLIPMFDSNLLATNPHIHYAESTRNGLAIVDITSEVVQVEFMLVGDVTTPKRSPTESITFRTPRGTCRIDPVG